MLNANKTNFKQVHLYILFVLCPYNIWNHLKWIIEKCFLAEIQVWEEISAVTIDFY